MKRITLDNYRKDKIYCRIVAAVERILEREREVRPVDVLVEMGLVSRTAVADWRAGRVPYLERVVRCNLAKASRILRILRMHAHDRKLSPKVVGYRHKGRRLRFSKSGDRGVEEAYARHFRVLGRGAPRAPIVRDSPDSAP
ncbi:MAG: hypothetical protein GY711_07110 [bacterium]|nr:hypothetical protein [bacterium]